MPKIIEPPLNDNEETTNAPSSSTKGNMRQSMQSVFDELGGEDGMVEWVKLNTANKRIFYRDIVPKLVNKESTVAVTGPEGGPMRFIWEGGPADPAKDTEKDLSVKKNVAASVAGSLNLDDNED